MIQQIPIELTLYSRHRIPKNTPMICNWIVELEDIINKVNVSSESTSLLT